MESIENLLKKASYEIFLLILSIVAAFSIIYGNVGQIILKIILSALSGFLALLIGENGLRRAFSKLGFDRYFRTITIILFVIIGLWNWFATIILVMFLALITIYNPR